MRQQTTPTKGTAIAMPVGVLKAGAVLCDAATMAHDCRATFLVAADENVDVVEIPRHVVVAAFEQLPQNITAPLLREAALQRETTLTTSAPMTATRVRLSRIFGSLNPNGVSFVAKRATPVCFTPGSVIVSRDKIPSQAYFVRRGYVALLDAAQRRVAVLRDGASLCEQEFFFGEKPQYMAVAISNVDLYTLRQVDFQALKASDVHSRALNAAANDERQRELQAVRENRSDMLLDSVRSIPIFNLFATPQAIADIAAAMTPRVLNSPRLDRHHREQLRSSRHTHTRISLGTHKRRHEPQIRVGGVHWLHVPRGAQVALRGRCAGSGRRVGAAARGVHDHPSAASHLQTNTRCHAATAAAVASAP
jgi:CRP-like cAMP-binding protein